MKKIYQESSTTFTGNTLQFDENNISISNISSFSSNINNKDDSSKRKVKKCKETKYSIALDMCKFKCSINMNKFNKIVKDRKFSYNNETYFIELDDYNNKSKWYLNMYKISSPKNTICNIYTNHKSDKSKSYCEVNNSLFYTNDWFNYINLLLKSISCNIFSIHSIAISLDTPDKTLYNLCNDYIFDDLIDVNNRNISIKPQVFHKKNQSFEGYHIGSKKSKKFFRVYNKTAELNKSEKEYIKDYWGLNELIEKNEENKENNKIIYRYEIELTSQNNFDLMFKSLNELTSIEKLKAIFNYQMKEWLKFYKIRKKDKEIKDKYYRIKYSTEIEYINWKMIPNNQNFLKAIPPKKSLIKSEQDTIRTIINDIAVHISSIPSFEIDPHIQYICDYCKNNDHLIEYALEKIDKVKGDKKYIRDTFEEKLKQVDENGLNQNIC